MDKLLAFLSDLEEANIHYTLEHNCPDNIMVMVVIPGERWEVEVFADGQVQVEVFRSVGIKGEEELQRLFRDYSD